MAMEIRTSSDFLSIGPSQRAAQNITCCSYTESPDLYTSSSYKNLRAVGLYSIYQLNDGLII